MKRRVRLAGGAVPRPTSAVAAAVTGDARVTEPGGDQGVEAATAEAAPWIEGDDRLAGGP